MTCVVQTQTLGRLQLDTMTGMNPQKHNLPARTSATASGYNISSGSNSFRGMPGFSLSNTEPIQGTNSGPYWNGTGEGKQYSHQDSSSSHGPPNGFSDSFAPFGASQETKTGLSQGRNSFSGSQSQWNTEIPTTRIESIEMSRYPSQDSVGAHSQRTTNSYDQNRSALYPNVSQMSFQMSTASSDVTGRSNSPDNSALFTPTQDMQNFVHFQYSEEDLSGANPMFHRDSMDSISTHPGGVAMSAGPAYNHIFASAGDDNFAPLATASSSMSSQGIYNPVALTDSPTMWDNAADFLDSRNSSPVIVDDSPWSLPPPQVMTSVTNSPLEYSPSIEGLSPRVIRKPIGPRISKVASDLAAARRQGRLPGTSETSDDSFKMVGRSSLEMDNTARDHHLYHNVSPHPDGLYHCPWEKDPTSNCQHKPEKLKCNYDKFVDSHLKPYKCKVSTCKELQFSSTACLLRHEREAHAMHGHGDKPFLCTYDGCERGVPGNGFPRHWNLRDHMKRVHNDPGQPKSNASNPGSPPSGPAKGKKRKAGEVEHAYPDKTSIKRIATPPVPAKAHSRELSLIERYQEKHALLMETAAKLADPKHADNMTLLRHANDCIKVMVQTNQRINSAPEITQQMG